jgi:hypothetical protein
LATATRAQSLALREARFEDYEQIYALERRNGLCSKPREEWLHLWLNNPVYRRLHDWPVGWVLESPEGRVVGSIGSIPVEYELEGRRLLASAGRAWAVDPEYRGYSVLLMDELFHQSGADLLLNTTVNRHAAAAYSLFESVRVPVGAWDRAGYWITDYQGFAQSALKFLKWTRAARAASYPAGALLYLRDAVRGRAGRSENRFSVEVTTSFDESFDNFWDELRTRQRHVLLGVRTREILAWHYRYRMAAGRLRILSIERNNRLLAYAVFTRQDKCWGLKRSCLADFQTLDDDPEIFRSLVERQLELCRREGVHLVEDRGCRAPHTAPHFRALPSWQYFYKAADESLAQKLENPACWRPSMYDGDSSL